MKIKNVVKIIVVLLVLSLLFVFNYGKYYSFNLRYSIQQGYFSDYIGASDDMDNKYFKENKDTLVYVCENGDKISHGLEH